MGMLTVRVESCLHHRLPDLTHILTIMHGGHRLRARLITAIYLQLVNMRLATGVVEPRNMYPVPKGPFSLYVRILEFVAMRKPLPSDCATLSLSCQIELRPTALSPEKRVTFNMT